MFSPNTVTQYHQQRIRSVSSKRSLSTRSKSDRPGSIRKRTIVIYDLKKSREQRPKQQKVCFVTFRVVQTQGKIIIITAGRGELKTDDLPACAYPGTRMFLTERSHKRHEQHPRSHRGQPHGSMHVQHHHAYLSIRGRLHCPDGVFTRGVRISLLFHSNG